MLNVCRAVFPACSCPELGDVPEPPRGPRQFLPAKLWIRELDANTAPKHSQLSHTFPALLKWPGNSSLSFLGSTSQELNRHLIKNPFNSNGSEHWNSAPARGVHIKASRVMWGSKSRCSPGVSLYLMVPQEFELMRKTKGTDVTLQWRKEKGKTKKCRWPRSDQSLDTEYGCYHVYLYSQLGQQPSPELSSCNAAGAQLWLQVPSATA